MAELSNKSQLSEEEIEKIKESLKCVFCSSAPKKPKMCKFYKRLFCSYCIKNWLLTNDYCVDCKKKISDKDLILVPFMEEMSSYYINIIEK